MGEGNLVAESFQGHSVFSVLHGHRGVQYMEDALCRSKAFLDIVPGRCKCLGGWDELGKYGDEGDELRGLKVGRGTQYQPATEIHHHGQHQGSEELAQG